MITGKTSTGFEFTMDERKAKSWRFVEAISGIKDGDSDLKIFQTLIPVLIDVIGEDQKELLRQHVTQIYGYDDSEAMMNEIYEIIGAARNNAQIKNFSSSQPASQTARTNYNATSQNITGFTTIENSQRNTSQYLQQG